MVLPSGRTKLAILFDTPHFSWESRMLIGSAAPDEQVEKAVSRAVDILEMCRQGFCLPISRTSSGRITPPWMSRPPQTTRTKMPSEPAIASRACGSSACLPTTFVTMANTPNGASRMMNIVIFMITS